MKKKQLHSKLWLLIILSALLIALTTFAVGKYMTTIHKNNNTVTFTARLAENVTLVESKINRKADGTYETADETVTGTTQSYILVPGQDIPKDPRVIITGKTDIPAYLYIEVVDNTPNDALHYSLTSDWIHSSRTASVTGASVYVYSTDGTNPAKITTDLTVYILQGNKIEVKQGLLSENTADSLNFFAYLEEVVTSNTP